MVPKGYALLTTKSGSHHSRPPTPLFQRYAGGKPNGIAHLGKRFPFFIFAIDSDVLTTWGNTFEALLAGGSWAAFRFVADLL